MGLRNDRLSRLRDAIAAWRQKIENERAAAEATARAEREAAENARELAEKTKATNEVATYLSELQTLETSIATLVSEIQTQEAIVHQAASDAQADTLSADAEVERDAAIDASAIITRKVNDLGVQKAALELAYYNIKKSADDYDDLEDDVTTGRTAYLAAIADIDSVADSKKNAESKVSYIVGRVSTLLAEEAAAAAEAARLAAIQAAEDARIADELLKATAAVNMYLDQVQTLAADIDTTVASLDTASATIGTNKTAAGNATASADAITARDTIAVQSANITVLVNTLGQKAAALETAYGNLVTAAGTHATLQDELATGTTEYNDAQTAIQSVSTAKKDAESHLAYAQNAASTLLASEAAAQAAADAAAAQAAAELEAARVASEAEATAIAAAEAKKTEAMTYTDNAIASLIDSAPGTLNTLNELAAALGDDPNFASTITSQLTNLDNQKVGNINITGKTVGSSTAIPVITYNNQGQITSATTTAITVGNGAMSVTAGGGLAGGGQVGTANQTGSSSVTISHADTSSVTNIDTSGKVVIDALTFDTYGHVTGATSRTLDFYTTSEANARYVNVTGDNMTGVLTMQGTNKYPLILRNNTNGAGAGIEFSDVTNTFSQKGYFYFDHQDGDSNSNGASFHFGTTEASLAIIAPSTGNYYVGTNKVFHDGYHPNADKWTTARTNTVTLTGDVTGSGSASVDGTGNWTVSLNTTVGNDSHSHSNYVLKAGDTMTGTLSFSNTASERKIDLNGNNAHLIGWESYHNTYGPGTWSSGTIGHKFFGAANSITAVIGTGGNPGSKNSVFYGNITAPTFIGALTGNASSATHAGRWTTARTLSLSGDASGSVSWDGSANATLNVTVNNDSHTHDGRYTQVHSGSFTVNGDANTYYPVYFAGGSQQLMTEVEIYRTYSETAPSTWNNSTHKGGLNFKFRANWGGWGGASYDLHVEDFRETYSTMVADVGWFGNNRGFYVLLRGGGARYHFRTSGGSAGTPTVYTAGTSVDPYGNGSGISARTSVNTSGHLYNRNYTRHGVLYSRNSEVLTEDDRSDFVSYYEGTSPPTTNGTMWLNTATGKTYQRQRGVWVQIAPGVGGIAIYDVNGTKVN